MSLYASVCSFPYSVERKSTLGKGTLSRLERGFADASGPQATPAWRDFYNTLELMGQLQERKPPPGRLSHKDLLPFGKNLQQEMLLYIQPLLLAFVVPVPLYLPASVLSIIWQQSEAADPCCQHRKFRVW